MGLSIIRRFTDLDASRVEAVAERFAERHDIYRTPPEWVDGMANRIWRAPTAWDDVEFAWRAPTAWDDVEFAVSYDKRLAKLWRAVFCRALGERRSKNLTVAYGYVGHRCN